MGVKETATKLHESGFNCAQSVLCACGKYTGLDEKTALAISGGLGGGVRCGEICGAITGAVMAVGMAYPYTDGSDADARALIARKTAETTNAFREKYGCVRCFELKEKRMSCAELIEFGAETAEKIINNK